MPSPGHWNDKESLTPPILVKKTTKKIRVIREIRAKKTNETTNVPHYTNFTTSSCLSAVIKRGILTILYIRV